MAKKTPIKTIKSTVEKRGPGQPTKYRSEFCQMLIDHMSKGGSFESFGADAQCHRQTLYEWEETHPEFSDAKKIGRERSLKFYEEMGKMIATGQLRMVRSETPMLDSNEKVVVDPNGNVVYKKEYMPAHASAGAWAFMMKNMHKWTDNRNIALSGDGKGAPIKVQPVQRSPYDDLKEIQEVQKVLKEIEDARKPIESIKITD
jgi:hypothetical protein